MTTNKNLLSSVLSNQFIWDICQLIFGANGEKRKIYRSVITNQGRLLDFGCANGNTFPAFKDFQYYGVDLDKIVIASANSKYSAFSNAHFFCQNILKKPLQKNYFDNILFACTGHHLNDTNLTEIVKTLSLTLKKGGHLHFFDMIRTDKDSSLLKLILNLDQGKYIRFEKQIQKIIKLFPKSLILNNKQIFNIKTFLIPKPKLIYYQFKKI